MTTSEQPNGQNNVNLVLGGGGAKGFVHIGVLKELVNRKYVIESIVGTSIGALIGALFAYQRAVEHASLPVLDAQLEAAATVEAACLGTDFSKLRDISRCRPFGRGLMRGHRIMDWLSKNLLGPEGDHAIRFRQLPFDLTITVTDADVGNCVILNRRRTPLLELDRAVRASISMQYLFREIQIEVDAKPVRAWDGGTTGNCRFDIAHRQHPQNLTVASSLTYRGEPRVTTGLGRIFKTYDHSISILMRQMEEVTRENLPSTARILIVRPDVDGTGTHAFGISRSRKTKLIENGQFAMQQALDGLVE